MNMMNMTCDVLTRQVLKPVVAEASRHSPSGAMLPAASTGLRQRTSAARGAQGLPVGIEFWGLQFIYWVYNRVILGIIYGLWKSLGFTVYILGVY